jgi:hypothetical protein
MRYLPLVLLSPTLLVLIWLYWSFPRGVSSLGRRLYDVMVIGMTVAACILANTYIDTAAPALDAFGRQSGQIWGQVKPALCGYGIATALLGVGLLVRSLAWRRGKAMAGKP